MDQPQSEKYTLKGLADLHERLLTLQTSKLPPRVKRMRMRLLQAEIDRMLILEKDAALDPSLCTRCQTEKPLSGAKFCRTCTETYLDAIPKWRREGLISQEHADLWMAELFKHLLDNAKIGEEFPVPLELIEPSHDGPTPNP